MLSLADAKSFCLATSQIIPALLIAIFVLDRNLTFFDYDRYRDTERKIERAIDATKEEEVLLDAQRRELEDIDHRLASLSGLASRIRLRDRLIDPWGHIKRIRAAKQAPGRTADLHAKLDKAAVKLSNDMKELSAIKESHAKLGRELRPKLIIYRLEIALAIILAISGESASLLGALGLLGLKKSIFVASISIISTVGMMANAFAWIFLHDLLSSKVIRAVLWTSSGIVGISIGSIIAQVSTMRVSPR